ncbi:MAG: DEAD/DEAH box helicase [Mycoplasmataceae bacterium]|nr:DEAD/DEAH box helicase [Mycoplasmataceae bacterium]
MNSDKDFETVIKIRTSRDEQLLRNIYSYGWCEMSLAQQRMLPKLLGCDFDDVSFQFPSGMGKSGVYLLTLLYNMDYKPEIKGLIVLPSRELAIQVFKDCRSLSRNMDVNICLCIGREELSQVDPNKPTIVIGTCGRIIDVMYNKNCKYFKQDLNLEYLIIDEADKLINNNNIQDIHKIVKLCNDDTHILNISATFSNNVRDFIRNKLMRKNGNNIEDYIDDCEVTLNGISQYYIDLTGIIEKRNIFNSKISVLMDIIPAIAISRGIIFVNTTEHAKQVYRALQKENFTCDIIYGKMTQDERNKIMKNFTNSGINFLIATDLISRGIDFKDVSYVIQLELPKNIEDYIHRIGRSGRYGKTGQAINIIYGDNEKRDLKCIMNKYEINMEKYVFE